MTVEHLVSAAVAIAVIIACVTAAGWLLLGAAQQIEDGRYRVAVRRKARHVYRLERRARRRWRWVDLVQLTRNRDTDTGTARVRVDHYLQARAADLDQQATTAKRRSVVAYFPPPWVPVLPVGIPQNTRAAASKTKTVKTAAAKKPAATGRKPDTPTSRAARPAGMPF